MIERNVEKLYSMLMNFTKLELTQVNFHGGMYLCLLSQCFSVVIKQLLHNDYF